MELTEKGKECQKQPSKLYVTSTFGLLVGILRQREFPVNGFEESGLFKSAYKLLNDLSSENENHDYRSSASSSAFFSSDDFGEANEALHKSNEPPISGNGSVPANSMNIKEINNSPLGSTNKKRAIAGHCKQIFSQLNEVCGTYRESLSSVLGNYFTSARSEEEENEVRDIISSVADSIIQAKGLKNGLSEIFSGEVLQSIMKNMRVPDWTLLYFKLKTRFPDSAWQTMLNVTQLGRSGVSTVIY